MTEERIKEIIIRIEHKDVTDDMENVTVNKNGISWTETLGYLERAKAIIVNSNR